MQPDWLDSPSLPSPNPHSRVFRILIFRIIQYSCTVHTQVSSTSIHVQICEPTTFRQFHDYCTRANFGTYVARSKRDYTVNLIECRLNSFRPRIVQMQHVLPHTSKRSIWPGSDESSVSYVHCKLLQISPFSNESELTLTSPRIRCFAGWSGVSTKRQSSPCHSRTIAVYTLVHESATPPSIGVAIPTVPATRRTPPWRI